MSTDPWATYWARTPEDARPCLPNADDGPGRVLRALWTSFARALPAKARVLDLATGGGIVPRALIAARRDLKPIGIDAAPTLPPPPPGVTLKAGVPMERLPFAASRFDAVTSQFGVEYGDVGNAAAEAARVLKPEGRFLFVVHHAGSRVVAHNRARAEALEWASRGNGLLDKAVALARARALAPLPTPPAFQAAIADARRRFPGQSVAEEFTAAIAQRLDMGRGRPAGETVAALEELRARAEGELGRIAALERAARDASGADAMVGMLQAAGLEVDPPGILKDAGAPLAWTIEGGRRDS
jgi:SAM-dependent methyltransferase